MFTAVCDYCGYSNCHYSNHPEALADMRAWEKERQREEFPFGDYNGY